MKLPALRVIICTQEVARSFEKGGDPCASIHIYLTKCDDVVFRALHVTHGISVF